MQRPGDMVAFLEMEQPRLKEVTGVALSVTWREARDGAGGQGSDLLLNAEGAATGWPRPLEPAPSMGTILCCSWLSSPSSAA